jgi:hypothetical protein
MCILLAGCSSQDNSRPAQGNEVSIVPATSSTPAALSPSPNADGSNAPTATGANFCTIFLADQKAAAEAIARAVRNPSTEEITLQDLRAARAKLQADLLLAPPHLQAYVRAQVETLDGFIRRLRAGSIKGLDLQAFENAQRELILHCRNGV